jgi:hypothetical protein
MAQFGIRSASKALTATTGNDTITMAGVGSPTLSSQTILGAEGNDVINLGAAGLTATLTSTLTNYSGNIAIGGISAVMTATFGGGGAATTAVATADSDTAAASSFAFTGVITADAGITTASKIQVKGQVGHDTIVFGSTLATMTASFIGGGQGNDYIGGGSFIGNEYTAGADSLANAALINSTIFGGKGRDTINLEGNAVFSAGKVNGYEDNDTLKFADGSATNYFVGGGKGNDTISGDFNKLFTSSIVGGQGQDSLILADIGSAVSVQIASDALDRSNTTANGADSIYISGSLRTSTILGGAGNDSLTIALSAASGNTIYLDAGNDRVSAIAGTDLTDTTIYFGGGDDEFILADTGKIASGRLIMGAGSDTVTLSSMPLETSTLAGLTIRGGAGADVLLAGTNILTGDTAEPVIEFQTSTDSTITAYDTIALDADGSDESADYVFNWMPGGAVRGTFSGDDVTASNGVVTFTGTFDASVTARSIAVASAGATNDTFAFADGSGNSYLFIMGAGGNTIAQVGSATITGDVQGAALTITDGKKISLNIGGIA